MAANVESLGALERRVSMSVQVEEIDRQVDERLKKLARDVRMPGFRPGKVPLKLVAQTYGPQVRSEVLGDAVQKAFTEVVKEANLRVAGYPRIEKKAAADDKALEFSATFEVYPEVKLGDISAASIERPQVEVDDAAVDRTIEILRKQRTRFVPARPSAAERPRTSSSRWVRAACCRSSTPPRAACRRARQKPSRSGFPTTTTARKWPERKPLTGSR